MLFRTILIISIVFIQGCSSFQQSNLSNNEIFAIGKAYFSKQKFQKAKDKFEIIVHNEQGTNLGLESTFYLAKSLFELEEYDEASYNFNYYSMFSKDIDNVEFAQYMKCRCAFEVTLPYNKDQSNSLYAISIIQEFLDNFPYSKYKEDSYQLIQKLRNRIAKKNFEAGRLYLKMKNFKSAFFYFDIILSEFYDTKFYDRALLYYIFTFIVKGNYDDAKSYYEKNKVNFISKEFDLEAKSMLKDYKNGLGFSGLYRLYK
ncbi:outer membrane protein assembly factor BamD [bacterium]|nr:MAG: outer membrane protein assembly factor BamD [bacterium]|tara:strand:+ start:648 stop:1421 length:774 start_codon:yes stop_codon:yes gene_type:complete